ncbi:hypothetical protein ACN26Y_22630 [Micromonospora sp. WMMD558]|uniref:hypothetical protein n=1 Tax=unclassified Micromonospora TaxID=2617518 RepID=UPI0012B49A8C|nr:hypothetical protein [Micromonospora sp. WMMC415]QGN48812.1 hypothetical protein GKC29_19645 [Micromonospora sp. WMMC415]
MLREDVRPKRTAAAPEAGSEATRYLCAAAHTDEAFAERALAEVLEDDLRAVAPSVGFDLTSVLRHCLHARGRRVRRDGWLLLAGGAAVLLSPLWTLLAGAAMVLGTRLAPFRPTRQGALGPVLALVSVALIALMLLVQLQGVAGAEQERTGLPGWLVGRPVLALPFGVVAYLVVVVHLLGTRRLLVTRLRRGRFRPASPDTSRDGRYAARLAAVDEAQRGNVTVYSGYVPFVGHGTPVAGWSFALPIVPAGPGSVLPAAPAGAAAADEPVPFAVLDLIDHVRSRLAAVGRDGPDADRLPDLLLEDRIFVGGRMLTDDARLLPDRERTPRQHWTDEEVRRVAARPRGAARHYLCALVPSWGGEVVAGTFLHFSTDGRVLYLECARTLVEPPRWEHHDVDRLTEWLPASQFAQLLASGAEGLLRTALGAPLRLTGDAVRVLRHHRRRARARRLAREDLGYDYGARAGVRELAAGSGYHNYFQVLDAAKHLKVVERHVLAAIVDFLDERGVDTAEFRSRQTMILNQGVIQTGGLSVVGNQAVGTGARAEQRAEQVPAPRGGRPRSE